MQKLAFAALVAVFSLIWSSAFIAAAIALEDFDPFTLLVVRFALGAAILLPFCLLNRELFDARVIRHGLLLGLLNNAIYLGLSFSALRTLRPEVVIVIISCAPFATTLLAVWLGLETFSMKMLTGIVLGFLGVVVMSGIASAQRPDIWGFLLAVAAMLAFTAGTVLFRRKAGELPVLKSISGSPLRALWRCCLWPSLLAAPFIFQLRPQLLPCSILPWWSRSAAWRSGWCSYARAGQRRPHRTIC